METFRFRYAMVTEIRANSKKEAEDIFENMDYDKLLFSSEYVELEDISKRW